MVQVRLQKFMAESGVGSRRKCEEYIASGLVTVNGKKVKESGVKVDPAKDKVFFLNKQININAKKYVMLNKPKDYITTKDDPKYRKTIYELLPDEYNGLHAVGRLDRQSMGLLLLTNDGELTNRVIHPTNKIVKIYRVTINNPLAEKAYERFEKGILLEGQLTLSAKCFYMDETGLTLEVHIKEGRNRQIRKMFQVLGYDVTRLKRIQIGGLKLGKLRLGSYRELSKFEIQKLEKV